MTAIAQSPSTLLRNTLRANAAFCAISGAISVVSSSALAEFLGIPDGAPLVVLGLGLLVYAAVLFYYTLQPVLDLRQAWIFTILDGLWVVGSAAVLALDLFALSNHGRWLVLILADIVLVFTILEYLGLRRLGGAR